MSAGLNTLHRTPGEFAQLVREFAQRLQSDPEFAHVMTVLCGSRERAQVFAQASGVGISTFAGLMHMPVSTARHYQRLGLLTPYEVNGKFRFWFHNVVQAESIRQWRDLGLSLEEIQAQRDRERLGGQAVTFNVPDAASVSVLLTEQALTVGRRWPAAPSVTSPYNQGSSYTAWRTLEGARTPVTSRQAFRELAAGGQDWPLDLERLYSEVRAARTRLEERLRALEAQLNRARQLEAALGQELAGPRS